MSGDLTINNDDAYVTYGIVMGDGFLDALGSPSPMKDYIENVSRLEHGRRIFSRNTKLDSRELTLVFNMEGTSISDYQDKKERFYNLLYSGEDIKISTRRSAEVFKLKYKNSVGYGEEPSGMFGKISVKFIEPNPTDRSND